MQRLLALAWRDAYAASIHHTLGGRQAYLSMGVERDERCCDERDGRRGRRGET
jgi:hypothetical protein